MASLHLVRSYCVPAVLYRCETWHLDRSDYHRLNLYGIILFERFLGVVGGKVTRVCSFTVVYYPCYIL